MLKRFQGKKRFVLVPLLLLALMLLFLLALGIKHRPGLFIYFNA